jgi:hypothetical protein
MSRSIFGRDLPPGCTLKHIEDAYGGEGPCECCGNDPADCICPECPICGEQGHPDCYIPVGETPMGMHPSRAHGMEYNREQRIGQCKMRIAALKEQIQGEEMALEYLQQQGDE